jgi:glycosyltransferase involved in cell wall biosynthesis
MLPELEEGGVECETVEMATHLVQSGHRSIVVSGGGRMVAPLEAAGSQHIRWAYIGEKSPRCLSYLLPLRRLLTRETVDILHLHSRLPAWVGYLAWKSLPRDRRPRLLTTFHGFYSINAYSAVMTRGERVVAVSRTIADHIKAAYNTPEYRIDIIYGGFDEERFEPDRVAPDRVADLFRKWRLPDTKTPLILLPGRFTRLKGHDLFFRSLARIEHLPWIAVCAGDLNENSDLLLGLKERLTALKLTDRVRFPGHCDDMPAALMLADVVVSASIKPESFGRVAIEAQAMGVPVIATAHGGSLETILNRETGWLVTPDDEASMADALAEAVSDKKLALAFGQNGRLWVRRNFTARKMFSETMDLYHRLVASDGDMNTLEARV